MQFIIRCSFYVLCRLSFVLCLLWCEPMCPLFYPFAFCVFFGDKGREQGGNGVGEFIDGVGGVFINGAIQMGYGARWLWNKRKVIHSVNNICVILFPQVKVFCSTWNVYICRFSSSIETNMRKWNIYYFSVDNFPRYWHFHCFSTLWQVRWNRLRSVRKSDSSFRTSLTRRCANSSFQEFEWHHHHPLFQICLAADPL